MISGIGIIVVILVAGGLTGILPLIVFALVLMRQVEREIRERNIIPVDDRRPAPRPRLSLGRRRKRGWPSGQ